MSLEFPFFGYVVGLAFLLLGAAFLAVSYLYLRGRRAAKEKRCRLETLVDNAPLPVIVHRNGVILYANRAAAAFFGVGSPVDLEESLISRFIEDFSPSSAGEGETAVREHAVHVADGSVRYAYALDSGVEYYGDSEVRLVQFMNKAMFRESQRKTSSQENEFRLLVAGLPVGVFKMNLANELSYANEKFLEIFSIPFEDDMPRDWFSFVLEEDRVRLFAALDETRLKFRETETAVRIRTVDGVVRRVSFRFSAAISDNEIHFVGVVSGLEDGGGDNHSTTTEEMSHGGAETLAAAVVQTEKKTNGRVLLAEDNLLNQKIVRRMLESFGVSCDTAVNGAEAIEMWKKGAYDLVIVDCQMPIMDGVETVRCMRRIEEGVAHRTPIVAMVAPTSGDDRERFLAVGVDECVTKPVTPEALRALIERIGGAQRPAWYDAGEVRAEENSVFDAEVVRRASGGDRRFEEETFDLFLTDTRRRLDRIASLVADGCDLDAVHKEASTIKGMGGTVGASMMKDAAFRLEKAAAEGDVAGVKSFYRSLEREFERVEAVITRYRRSVSTGGGA